MTSATKTQQDANGLQLSNQTHSGYRFVTTLFDGPKAGKYFAFADVPADLHEDCKEFKAGNGDSAFGYMNVVTLGEFDDVRDAAYVAQEFFGVDTSDRDHNLRRLFAGDPNVIVTSIPAWNHPASVASVAAGAKRATVRKQTAIKGKRVPTGSLASVKAKLSAMFPNASVAEISRAAVMCIRERGGAEFISELGLA